LKYFFKVIDPTLQTDQLALTVKLQQLEFLSSFLSAQILLTSEGPRSL